MKKESKKPVYILCPRCELNYIEKTDKYCNVCKAEMGLVDSSILIPEDEEDLVGLEKLCPVCRLNIIGEDEDICFLCAKEKADKEKTHEEEDWAIEEEDPVPAEELEISLELAAEEEAEEDMDFDEEYRNVDDFDYDIDPDDFEEDFDEDYDEEEFDDEEED